VLCRDILLQQAKQFPSTNSLGADIAIQNKSRARSAVSKAKSGIGKLRSRLKSIAKKKGLNSSTNGGESVDEGEGEGERRAVPCCTATTSLAIPFHQLVRRRQCHSEQIQGKERSQ